MQAMSRRSSNPESLRFGRLMHQVHVDIICFDSVYGSVSTWSSVLRTLSDAVDSTVALRSLGLVPILRYGQHANSNSGNISMNFSKVDIRRACFGNSTKYPK